MEALLKASKKIQTWIHSHPRKATIVRHVIEEFDKAIEDTEDRITYLKKIEDLKITERREYGAPSDEPGCFNPNGPTNTITREMKEVTKNKLFEAWQFCDDNDKSTEFMLQYM